MRYLFIYIFSKNNCHREEKASSGKSCKVFAKFCKMYFAKFLRSRRSKIMSLVKISDWLH